MVNVKDNYYYDINNVHIYTSGLVPASSFSRNSKESGHETIIILHLMNRDQHCLLYDVTVTVHVLVLVYSGVPLSYAY